MQLSLVSSSMSNRTVSARMVLSLAAFSSLPMRRATQSGDGTLDTWNRPSIPHFHHRLQAAPGSSSETRASAGAASATSTTTVRSVTTSRHGALPTCPLGTRRFSSTRRSGSIEKPWLWCLRGGFNGTKKVTGHILVPLKRNDRIEDILPYLEQIARPGCKVTLLVHYSVEGLDWFQS